MCFTITQPRSPAKHLKTHNVYQFLLHKVFLPMTKGLLTLNLPNGETLHYGFGKEGETRATIRILNDDFFEKCVLYGDIGFGESYVDGDWETEDIKSVIEWMLLNLDNHPTLTADKPKRKPVNFMRSFNVLMHKLRINSQTGSRKNISAHYDLSNNFFKLFLDPTMTYSSAYFKGKPDDLEQAQILKYEVLCQKLRLKRTDHVLEIGSGWGGFAIHAAKNYGCKVVTITVSKEQYAYAKERIKAEKLNQQIDLRFLDYRNLKGKFDKIVSIEMIEAVGHEFLAKYFEKIHECLKKDGLLALQMITSPDHRYEAFRKNVDWIQKHIFPGSLLPSFSVIQSSIRRTGDLALLDFEDLTASYVKTLLLWRDNFNRNLDEVRTLGFSETFLRKWNYYLSYCAAAFNMHNISVVQAVFSRPNNYSLIQT